MQIIISLSNIVFLNNATYEYNNYLFVGTTLWSNITNNNLLYVLNDFNCAKDLIINKYNNYYFNNYLFINNTLILLIHHLSSYKLIHKKYKSHGSLNQCFASDCDELFLQNIKLWIWTYSLS